MYPIIPAPSLDNQTLQDLNNYFGDLCFDSDYIEPNLMEIRENCEVPEISERQVWNVLKGLKKTPLALTRFLIEYGKTTPRYLHL